MQFPPVKELALELGIEVFQPNQVKTQETLAKLAQVEADFFVVIAYGRILPQTILDLPKVAPINLHASLLPHWRGAAPIQRALMAGEATTGVCSMKMSLAMDEGEVLLSEKEPIRPDDTYGTLSERLSQLAAKVGVETLECFASLNPQPQDGALATYARMIEKSEGQIDWSQSAQTIYQQFQGLTPRPGVFTHHRGHGLKVLYCRPHPTQGEPGRILSLSPLLVGCGQGALELISLQPESKKPVGAVDWINGFQIREGDWLET